MLYAQNGIEGRRYAGNESSASVGSMAPASDAARAADRPTILIVDDTPANVQLLGEVLGAHYRTKAATSGERALRIAMSDEPPDLILLDVMMPGLSGHEVCERLKAAPRTARIPVIFVTAMSEVDDETHGLALGAVDYITKPISPPIVLARIQTHLMLARQARELEGAVALLEPALQAPPGAPVDEPLAALEQALHEVVGLFSRVNLDKSD
jgi:CheY-like chemotaxis protein